MTHAAPRNTASPTRSRCGPDMPARAAATTFFAEVPVPFAPSAKARALTRAAFVALLAFAACSRIDPASRSFPCATDADCLEGWSCPEAPLRSVRVCRQGKARPETPDAGSPAEVDAGTVEAPDAGADAAPDAGEESRPDAGFADPCGLLDGDGTAVDGAGWTLQLGNDGYDTATGIARAADGSLYVSGLTGDSATGSTRAILLKLDASGAPAWCHPTGAASETALVEWAAVAIGADGDVYVAGDTDAPVAPGVVEAAAEDVVVARYHPDGTRAWVKQFAFSNGGTASTEHALGLAIASDGHLHVVGDTDGRIAGEPAAPASGGTALFLTIDTDGRLLETRTLAASGGSAGATGVGTDGTRLFAALWSGDSLKGTLGLGEGWVTLAEIPATGRPVVREELGFGNLIGGPSTGPLAILVPAGVSPVIVGGVQSSLAGVAAVGGEDAFAARLGTGAWKARFGSSAQDLGTAVAACGNDLCVAGVTSGTITAAGPSLGGADAFVARLRTLDGATVAIQRFGTGDADQANGLVADGAGGVVVVGRTDGRLGTRAGGASDLFVRRLVP